MRPLFIAVKIAMNKLTASHKGYTSDKYSIVMVNILRNVSQADNCLRAENSARLVNVAYRKIKIEIVIELPPFCVIFI